MKIDTTGVIISTVLGVDKSNLGSDYICVWDADSLPMHIHKSVLEYLCRSVYGSTPQESQSKNSDDPFI